MGALFGLLFLGIGFLVIPEITLYTGNGSILLTSAAFILVGALILIGAANSFFYGDVQGPFFARMKSDDSGREIVKVRCLQCGELNDDSATVCIKCGYQIGTPGAS
jgi:hypothetical protein